jgi:hypothetical protein
LLDANMGTPQVGLEIRKCNGGGPIPQNTLQDVLLTIEGCLLSQRRDAPSNSQGGQLHLVNGWINLREQPKTLQANLCCHGSGLANGPRQRSERMRRVEHRVVFSEQSGGDEQC